MAVQQKTQRLIDAALRELEEYHPMTLRQLHYRLVEGVKVYGDFEYDNTLSYYKKLSRTVAEARLSGDIPWEYIEDRLREATRWKAYASPAELIEEAAQRYFKDYWLYQNRLVEVWLEKDALSGVFRNTCGRYRITFNVGRGYDSWTAVHKAAQRYERWMRGSSKYADEDVERSACVLYFGDFDPSGEDMVRSLEERLGRLTTVAPEVRKCALTLEQIEERGLPPAIPKASDARRDGFVARYGERAVELDALRPTDLQRMVGDAIEAELDYVRISHG